MKGFQKSFNRAMAAVSAKTRDPRPDLTDAIMLLTQAIKIHERHLGDPASVTPKSQGDLMQAIRDARIATRKAFDLIEGTRR